MTFPEDPINAYPMGQRVTLFVDFLDKAGAAADPDVVTLRYIEADDTAVTVLQGSLDNPTVGRWAYDVDMPLDGDKSGVWSYRFEGTSAAASGVNAAEEKRLELEPSPFYPPT